MLNKYNDNNAASLLWKYKIQIRSVSNMNDKYENLANAIVLQAVKGCNKALRTLSHYTNSQLKAEVVV